MVRAFRREYGTIGSSPGTHMTHTVKSDESLCPLRADDVADKGNVVAGAGGACSGAPVVTCTDLATVSTAEWEVGTVTGMGVGMGAGSPEPAGADPPGAATAVAVAVTMPRVRALRLPSPRAALGFNGGNVAADTGNVLARTHGASTGARDRPEVVPGGMDDNAAGANGGGRIMEGVTEGPDAVGLPVVLVVVVAVALEAPVLVAEVVICVAAAVTAAAAGGAVAMPGPDEATTGVVDVVVLMADTTPSFSTVVTLLVCVVTTGAIVEPEVEAAAVAVPSPILGTVAPAA